MDYEGLKRDLSHVTAVTTTPFEKDGSQVKHDAIGQNIERLLDAGIRSFMACGGAGEIGSLSMEEQVRVVETTVDAVGNSGSVFGGVTGNYKDALHLVRQYEDAGADGVHVRPPNQRGVHERALSSYYKTIVESTDLGVMIYMDDPVATDATVRALSSLDNVLAVKYKDDVEAFTRTRSVLDKDVFDDLVWLCGRVGTELSTVAFGMEGANGFTSGLANFIPDVSIALFEAIREEDWQRAVSLRELVRQYQELGFETGANNSIGGANSIPTLKYGQELAGMYGGPARKPLIEELSDADKTRAREYYDRIQSGFDEINSE